MHLEYKYKTLTFPNSENGQRRKVSAIEELEKDGWEILTEKVGNGEFRMKTAFCLSLFFLPCAMLAGETKGEIVVTARKLKNLYDYS